VCPVDGSSPAENVAAIVRELQRFSPTLAARERWLVLNKLDLLPESEREKTCKAIVRQLKWKGPVFKISAISASGTTEMCQKIMVYLEAQKAQEAEDPELLDAEAERQRTMQAEAREKIRALAAKRRAAREGEPAPDDNWDDDENGIAVEYVP